MADAGVDVRGMLKLEQLRKRIPTKEIDTVVVGFTDHYGRLMGKRYDAEMFVDSVAEAFGSPCSAKMLDHAVSYNSSVGSRCTDSRSAAANALHRRGSSRSATDREAG
jgi:hypothetical protein